MRIWWIAWTIFSWLSVIFCCVGALLPHWIHGTLYERQHGEVSSNIGLFRRCTYPIYTAEGAVLLLRQCGQYEFLLIPNLYWQVSLVILLIACSVGLTITFIIFFLGCCLDLLQIQSVQRGIQLVQLFAGLLALTACIIYPFGWIDNVEVEQICGNTSGRFRLGRCQIGWAFVMSTMGGLFTILTSFLPTIMNYRHIQRTRGIFFPVPTQDTQTATSQRTQYTPNKGRRHSQPNLPYGDHCPPVIHRSRPSAATARRMSLRPDAKSIVEGSSNRQTHRHSTPLMASTSPTSFLLSSAGNHSSVESQLTHLWIISPAPTATGGSISSVHPATQKYFYQHQHTRSANVLEGGTIPTPDSDRLDHLSRETSQESIVPSSVSMHNFNKQRGVRSTRSCDSPMQQSGGTPSSEIQ